MNGWHERLGYVIVDEAHCISKGNDSFAWEHLLVLIDCPFAVLSAAVGNGKEFAQWVSKLRADRQVRLIRHEDKPMSRRFCAYAGMNVADVVGDMQVWEDDSDEEVDLNTIAEAGAQVEADIVTLHPAGMLSLQEHHLLASKPWLRPSRCLYAFLREL